MLEILSKAQLEQLHNTSIEILEKIGVSFYHKSALKIFKDAGANVNGTLVKIPEYLVKESLSKALHNFIWYARDPKHNLHIGDSKVYYSGIYGHPFVLDMKDGKRRRALLKDVEEITKITDALEYIHAAGGMIVEPSDVRTEVSHVYVYLSMLKNTGKCILGHAYGIKAQDCIEMARIVVGSYEELLKKPFIATIINSTSPLQYGAEMIEGLLSYVKYNQPVIITPLAQAGGTAPVTLAGLLAQQNAEFLAGFTLVQLIRPKNPVFYGSASTIMDMKTGIPSVGAPEAGLIGAVTAQLARFYQLPSRVSAGLTDSKIPDIQAGYEKALTCMLVSLAGANLVLHAAGSLEYYLTASPIQLIVDNEILGWISRILSGIEINEETLAFNVIKNAREIGHFLTQKHTLNYFKKEFWIPKITDRCSWSEWKNKGAKDLVNKAKEEAEKILIEHNPKPLDEDILKELNNFIKKIEKQRMEKNKK
ncbi:MAG: trimethylamine methyltransferase family protein [Candidatus Bathyarchaeia archaeon]|nr:trimethylamine methyltransferase family protein [Candidatus Bathyarchaeota archaeon]